MTHLPLYALLLLISVSNIAPTLADEAAGNALYAACASCHGAQAEGNPALQAPVLAGLSASYLSRQLQHFKSGRRGSDPADSAAAPMRAIAASLEDEQAVSALATYLAALPPPTIKPSLTGNIALGSRLYQAKCGACHGGKAEGNPAMNTPRLRQQHDSYLQRQVSHFRQGLRGSDPTDRYGKQMKMMAASVNDAELLDVLAYISSLGQP
jgi:cytochrome c553